MPKHTRRVVNLLQSSFGRRRLAKRSVALKRSYACMEAMETRRLLSGYSGYTFTLAAQPGTNQAAINLANGTYLQNVINGTTLLSNSQVSNHTLTLGDTLILPDAYVYDMGSQILNLPDLGAAATATWNSTSESVTALNLTFAPAGGYTAAPTVVIFGGGGSGATGSVTYNSTTGTVTGISLTNDGSGYTSAPQVAIEGGAETLTIESTGYVNDDFGSGRFTPTTATVADLARISGHNVDGIIETNDPTVEDAYAHLGAAQNYAFDGLEICPDADTDICQVPYVQIGDAASDQNNANLVANNFTFNQDYVHGGTPGETSDDLSTAKLDTAERGGFRLDANYITIENSQISDITQPLFDGNQTQCIGGCNALGNFTINNNYLEATGEDIMFGGTNIYLPSPDQVTNVSITNNYVTKNPAWNPNLPQFAGVAQAVCNDIELKTAIDITISHNVIENSWIGADSQRGQAINISNIDQNGIDPWTDVADVTIADNVIRNVGMVLDISAGFGSTPYENNESGPSGIAHDITFSNNLAYNVGGFQWGLDEDQKAISMSGPQAPMQNITIENNTIIGMNNYIYQYASSDGALVANFVIENNVFDESTGGLSGSDGSDIKGLNSVYNAALTVTDSGSGYTLAPTVTLSGGGGSNATAVAYIWPQTEVCGAAGTLPCPFAGQIEYIQITNYGSGYTSAPTVSFNNTGTGGSGAAASALYPVNDWDDTIHGYDFQNNVIIGGASSNYPTDNYFPANENAVQMLDPAGDEYGLLSTSPYYADGTNTDPNNGNSTVPGVNMTTLLAANNGSAIPWQPADAANSLQNYYKFNEGTGTTAYDNGLGTHENGTLNGTVSWSSTGPAGGGITLSGGNTGNVSVANFTADAAFTFAAWVKPTNFSATQYIASTKNSSSVSAFSLSINTSGQLVATGTTGSVTANASLAAGAWSLVGVSYSSGTLTLYVNGAEVPSTTSGTPTTTTGTTTLYIGGNQGSVNSFNGTIDEVRYYSIALSPTMDVTGNTYLGRAGGSGYAAGTNGFAVTFSGGGGSGAAATAYAGSDGEITSIIMSNSGSGYTSAPTMSFGTNGSGASDTAFMSVTPLSYLYAQYGPYFLPTELTGETLVTTAKSATFTTQALSPDENYSALTYTMTCLTYPKAAYVNPPTIGSGADPSVTFYGAGYYLFQCLATNSLGQTATLDIPVTVDPVVTPGQVVTPANVSLAPKGTQTFTVNGTSIANLSGLVDQFGNPMPSSEWSWGVANENNVGSITSAGVYTAGSPGTLPDPLGDAVHLLYTTGDGVTYIQGTASVTIVSANVPNAPASIAVTPGTSNSNVITWTGAPGGETGFDVYIDTNPPYGGTIIYNDTSTSTLSYTDTSESPGSTVYYYVDAYNANGGGPDTAELGIVTGAPAAPTNLTATGSINSVELSWTNTATNATSVTVLRSQDSNLADANLIATLSGTATAFIDNATNDPTNAPADGTTYYYWVETNNTYSSLPAVSLDATPFGPPTGLTASAVSSTQMFVNWTDLSGGQANFQLQYENANGGSWSSPININAGTTNYLLTTGLSADTQYNFEIQAYTTVGGDTYSGWSNPVSGRTWNASSLPPIYEGFAYPGVAGSSTQLNGENGGVGWSSAWSASSDYDLATSGLVDGNSTVAADLLTTPGSMAQNYPNETTALRTLSSTIGGGSTTVWVSALVTPGYNSGGILELISGSSEFKIYSAAAGGEFGIGINSNEWYDTSLTVTAGDTYFLVAEIEYGVPSGSNTYNLWVDPNPSQSSSSWTLGEGKANSLSFGAISSVEFDGVGVTDWDELRIGTGTNSSVVTPLALPNAPTSLSASPTGNSIALSWTASNSSSNVVQGYDIWRSTNGGASYGSAPYATVGSSTLSYTDSSVSGATAYYYEVTAENTTGDSLNSNIVSASTIPAAPSNLVATPGTNSIALTWTDPGNTSNITGYHVWRSTDNSTWGSSAYATVTGATASTYTDTTPGSGTEYYYEVTSYNSGGNSTTAAGMTCGVATVIAYEGFQYTTSSTWAGGVNSGVGFSGNWSVSNSNNASIVAGLTYTSGSSVLTTSGNALKLASADKATTTLSQSVGASGSTLWIGFEFSTYSTTSSQLPFAELDLGTTSDQLEMGATYTDHVGAAEALISGTNYYLTAPTVLTANTTYFVVYEIQYQSASDIISMWADPALGPSAPATPTGTLTLPSSALLAHTNLMDLTPRISTSVPTFDEIRLGTSYYSVAPDPKVEGISSQGNSSKTPVNGKSHRRRTPFFAASPTQTPQGQPAWAALAQANGYRFSQNTGFAFGNAAAGAADDLVLGVNLDKKGCFWG